MNQVTMKTRFSLGILLLFLFAFSFTGCDKDDTGRKVTDYKEYIFIVAPTKVPGVVTSCGNNLLTDVYAVMKEHSTEWEALGSIDGFEYESGYEYQIRISETSYLDYTMGEPAWTEHKLLQVISKDKKDPEGLPSHFIPEWYYKNHFVPEYSYAVEAEDKELIEEDLKVNSILPPQCHYLLYGSGFSEWIIIDNENNVLGQGDLKKINKDPKEFPESYKILPPEGKIHGCMEWTFLDESGNGTAYPSFDVFLAEASKTKSEYIPNITPCLYRDLTEYYKNKYPEVGVKTVVVCYAIEIF